MALNGNGRWKIVATVAGLAAIVIASYNFLGGFATRGELAEVKRVAETVQAEQQRRTTAVLSVPALQAEIKSELAEIRRQQVDTTDRLARIETALGLRGPGRRERP